MSRVFWCVGKKSDQPFWLEAFQVSIYSLEELCYLIRKKTELVDESLMTEELIAFMEHALCLETKQLRTHVESGGSLEEFCRMILCLGQCRIPDEAWEKIHDTLAANAEMTPFERNIRRAEDWLKQGRYFAAFQSFGRLAGQTDQASQQAELYGQMGRAAFYLFHYRVAADCFEKSYSLSKNRDMRFGYFLCQRFLMNRQQYMTFTTKNEEDYELSMQVERLFAEAQKRAKAQADAVLTLPDERSLVREFREMME